MLKERKVILLKHLYVVSDDDIKENDWCYCENSDVIIQFNNSVGCVLANQQKKKYGTKTFFKVIGTTDPTLLDVPKLSDETISGLLARLNPKNPMINVLVEYVVDKYDIRNQYKDCPSGKYWMDEPIPPSPDNLYSNAQYYIPKVNEDDRTINVTFIKENWSRTEVIELFDLFIEDIDLFYNGQSFNVKEYTNFIEKNL